MHTCALAVRLAVFFVGTNSGSGLAVLVTFFCTFLVGLICAGRLGNKGSTGIVGVVLGCPALLQSTHAAIK